MSDESIIYVNGSLHIVDDEWLAENEEVTIPIHAEAVVVDGQFTTDLIDEKWPFGGEIRVELKVMIKRLAGNIVAQFDALFYEGDSEATMDLADEAHFQTVIPAGGFEKKFTLINAGFGGGDMADFDLIFTYVTPSQPLLVTPNMAGVWRGGSGAQQLVHENWDNFVQKWSSLSGLGYRLVDIEPWGSDNNRSWYGIFRPGSGGYALWRGNWDGFVATDQQLSNSGVYLIDVTTYMEKGARVWVGVWKGGVKKPTLVTGLDWSAFTSKWQKLAEQGLRLIDVQSYIHSGSRKWAGLFRPGVGGYALYNANWTEFTKKWQELGKSGLRLVDLHTYKEGDQRMWAGAWLPGTDGYALWVGGAPQFQQQNATLQGQGLRLVDLELL